MAGGGGGFNYASGLGAAQRGDMSAYADVVMNGKTDTIDLKSTLTGAAGTLTLTANSLIMTWSLA